MTALAPLSTGRILRFWLPLLATWQMMSIEGPFLAAVIARLPDATFNLAAYGVAFSLAMIVESPIIMMMTASTALVKGRLSYLRLRNFAFAANAFITLLMLLIVSPVLFPVVSETLMRLPHPVASLTHVATAVLLPWPAAIGFRRFYQGLLIQSNLTRRVAYGTVIRLLGMAGGATALALWTDLPGAVVGTSALSIGVVSEAVASRIMAAGSIARVLRETDPDPSAVPGYRDIWRFYHPLASTSVLALGVHPMVAFFLGQSRMSLESLAVMPVINSLVFFFRSFGLSYQEVAVSWLGQSWEHFRPIRNVALGIGAVALAGLVLVAFSPLAELWYGSVSGLSPDLVAFALPPTQLLVLMPATSMLLTMQRSILVVAKRTRPITLGTMAEVGTILAMLLLGIAVLDLVGAVAAALALLAGRLTANVLLYRPVSGALAPLKRAKREGDESR